jgi:hypothetical protein
MDKALAVLLHADDCCSRTETLVASREYESAIGDKMILPSGLVCALSSYAATHIGAMNPSVWKTRDNAWRKLRTGFDYQKYKNDLLRQNVELKLHLAEHWAKSSLDEKLRVANWIVRDWGGINRNTEMTILGYVNQADAERPATPFFGIASYSKIELKTRRNMPSLMRALPPA